MIPNKNELKVNNLLFMSGSFLLKNYHNVDVIELSEILYHCIIVSMVLLLKILFVK